jgi:hypothetical protein
MKDNGKTLGAKESEALALVRALTDVELSAVRQAARELPVEVLAAVVAELGGVDVEMAALLSRAGLEEVVARLAAFDAVLRYLRALDGGAL